MWQLHGGNECFFGRMLHRGTSTRTKRIKSHYLAAQANSVWSPPTILPLDDNPNRRNPSMTKKNKSQKYITTISAPNIAPNTSSMPSQASQSQQKHFQLNPQQSKLSSLKTSQPSFQQIQARMRAQYQPFKSKTSQNNAPRQAVISESLSQQPKDIQATAPQVQPAITESSSCTPSTSFASLSVPPPFSAPVLRLPTPPGSISERSDAQSPSGNSPTSAIYDTTAALEELQLLDDTSQDSRGQSRDHELRTAPLYTRDAYIAADIRDYRAQYGVLGKVIQTYSKRSSEAPEDSRLYVNTNAPFSAIVCGVQGSGKSHTVSVLLESMFIPRCRQIGSLEKPLCGLVLHFGEGGPSSRPCEASWVGVPSYFGVNTPPVRVFVSRSSLNTMKAVYAPLGHRVTVEPLFFSEDELDAEAFLSMMAVGSSESAPLYVQLILSILRDLGENYTYREFMARLEDCKTTFNPAQLAGLEQRMALLTSFMDPNNKGLSQLRPRFAAGQLSIVDLSDPFIDPTSACGLFEIVTRLFVRADVGTGKVLVVDEAHKYLSANKGSSGLTKSLLTLTREQRHLAMRVIISTQEPTVVPSVLLDLCTVAILHRFSSPSWWEHVANHVSADVSAEEAFDKVVGLQTGEAIVLAPSGLGVVQEHIPDASGPAVKKLGQLGRRYMLMKTRKRVTADGGASILVLDS